VKLKVISALLSAGFKGIDTTRLLFKLIQAEVSRMSANKRRTNYFWIKTCIKYNGLRFFLKLYQIIKICNCVNVQIN